MWLSAFAGSNPVSRIIFENKRLIYLTIIKIYMSTRIEGKYSGEEIHDGSSFIHIIKHLACVVEGYKGNFANYYEESRKGARFWEKYPRFWQILHLNDECDVLLPNEYLDLDYKDSFSSGSSKMLLSELETISKVLIERPDVGDTESRERFQSLYDLVKKEFEEYEDDGIITIS